MGSTPRAGQPVGARNSVTMSRPPRPSRRAPLGAAFGAPSLPKPPLPPATTRAD